jgi:hypothetical protein
MRSSLLTLAVVTAALIATGCAGTTTLLRALGQDTASICVSVTMVYGERAACRVPAPPR